MENVNAMQGLRAFRKEHPVSVHRAFPADLATLQDYLASKLPFQISFENALDTNKDHESAGLMYSST